MSLRRWADQHRLPFLSGTDGLTYRQRRASARRYAERIRQTPEDITRVRLLLSRLAGGRPQH